VGVYCIKWIIKNLKIAGSFIIAQKKQERNVLPFHLMGENAGRSQALLRG